MKCPNCGNEIQDGHLICENCGYELQIVPDFDPEVEIQIDDIIEDTKENVYKLEKKDPYLEDTVSDPKEGIFALKNRALLVIIIILASLIVVIGVVLVILHTNSLDYQLNKVKRKAAEGKYEEAIEKIENLYVHNPYEGELFLLEADYYLELDKPEMAEDTLFRVIKNKNFDKTDIYQAYDRLVALYVEEEDYNAINSLLSDCEYQDIITAYQNYLAMTPTFSEDSGEYSDVVRLKLSANTSGTIYYTLDGSVPNTTSSIYEGPILLESGEYIVSAIFINQYGLSSDIAKASYKILLKAPEAPVVNYESGSYNEPTLIIVEVPEDCEVYYTTDKSTPTVDSIPYTGPIPIPLNYSNFNFIAVNEQGLCSDVVVRSYHLSFPNGIPKEHAITLLKERLVERGMLTDTSGKSNRAPGIYTYAASSAIRIANQGDYYIINEFYHDGAGNVTTSDTTYIVNIYDGTIGILGGDALYGFTALVF